MVDQEHNRVSIPTELEPLRTHLADFETTTTYLLRPIEARALLNFAALFHEVAFITDTAIGDNRLIIESFRDEGHSGLAAQIKRLIQEKILYVLCRDRVVVRDRILVPKNPTIREIYNGWKYRDASEWGGDTGFTAIVSEELRFAYYREIDDLLTRHNAIVRYDPDKPKVAFRNKIRRQLNSDQSNMLSQSIAQLPTELQRQYFSAVQDHWFTNAELWRVPRKSSDTTGQIILHAHVNQQCFAEITDSGVSAHDRATSSLASFNLELQRNTPHALETDATLEPPESLLDLLDSAPVKLLSPGIEMFGQLSIEDVLALRRMALPIFALARQPRQAGDEAVLQAKYLRALEAYWKYIMAEFELKYPQQMLQTTRCGLFLETHAPPISRLYRKFGKSILAMLLRFTLSPPAQALAAPGSDIIDHLGFIFLHERTDTNEQLRSVVPPTHWFPRGILRLDGTNPDRPYR